MEAPVACLIQPCGLPPSFFPIHPFPLVPRAPFLLAEAFSSVSLRLVFYLPSPCEPSLLPLFSAVRSRRALPAFHARFPLLATSLILPTSLIVPPRWHLPFSSAL